MVSEKDDLKQTENENKGGPYDPEMYRLPEKNLKDAMIDSDVTDQFLNGPLALQVPGRYSIQHSSKMYGGILVVSNNKHLPT